MAVQRGWRRKRLVLIIAFVFALSSFLGLSSCGGNESKAAVSATKAGDPLDPTLVKSLYTAKCGICHGTDGAMNYAGAKDLSISTLPKEEVVGQITYGKGTMPPMEKQLTSEQIAAVADYCISLRKK